MSKRGVYIVTDYALVALLKPVRVDLLEDGRERTRYELPRDERISISEGTVDVLVDGARYTCAPLALGSARAYVHGKLELLLCVSRGRFDCLVVSTLQMLKRGQKDFLSILDGHVTSMRRIVYAGGEDAFFVLTDARGTSKRCSYHEALVLIDQCLAVRTVHRDRNPLSVEIAS